MFNSQQKNGNKLSLNIAKQVKWLVLVVMALALSLSQSPRVAHAAWHLDGVCGRDSHRYR